MANTPTKGTAPRASKIRVEKNPAKTGEARPRKAKAKPLGVVHEISPDLRQQMIAEAAYLRAEQRGFGPGDPVEDWLNAEREVDMLLAERPPRTTQ